MSVVPLVPLNQNNTVEEEELKSFVYNVGFLHAAWSDTVLNITNLPTLRLHALFISQSPVLCHHLTSQTPNQGQYQINLTNNDPALTASAVSTVLATLYGHPIDIQTSDFDFARGLIAAGSLFGLEKITSHAYDLLLKTISKETLPKFVELALTPSYDASDSSVNAGPYPAFTKGLASSITNYIIDNFVVEKCDDAWTNAFLSLPFNMYKDIIESPKLQVATGMDRHKFANFMTKKRNQPDEQVLLAFGNGTHGVQVVRRQKKRSSKGKNNA